MENPYMLAGRLLQSPMDGEPAGAFAALDLYGAAAHDPHPEGDACRRFQLENESGTGEIALYPVFPGITLVYNDMHMAYCNKHQSPAPHVMEINYCKEGRCECRFGAHLYCYMAAGDLSFCSLHRRAHQSEFPTSHYHGITVTVDFSAVNCDMRQILASLGVDLERIQALAQAREFTIVRAEPTLEHIFLELYNVPVSIRLGYIRLKVLELLLVLTELRPDAERTTHAHFTAAQINAVKQVHAFLLAHFNEHHTIDSLAAQCGLSPTVLKKCFRGVYGDSIYAYQKRYRLQVAERLLKEGTLNIGEIAARIGYLNPNKFTSAFCAAYGVSPTAYRKEV